MPRVVIVTDSTASLPLEVASQRGIVVVPLQVIIGSTSYDEGATGATPARVAEALVAREPVSTSRPAPAVMLELYRQLAAQGAAEILAIHLSSELSGTFESAELAARESPVPVTVIDTRQVGIATGFAVLAAADVLDAGGGAAAAADAARIRAAACTSLFYVDTLDYLRRGGRIGAAAALFGGALSVKPLLRIEDGAVGMVEKVRTTGRAIARLEDLAVEAAGDADIDVGVAHLANPERAGELAQHLGATLATNLDGRSVWVGEVGAVLGAHVGPGMLAVCIAPRLD